VDDGNLKPFLFQAFFGVQKRSYNSTYVVGPRVGNDNNFFCGEGVRFFHDFGVVERVFVINDLWNCGRDYRI